MTPPNDYGQKQDENRQKRSDGGGRRPFFRRRKTCPFSGTNAPKIDYKDVKLLRRFVTEQGKIMPRRVTGTSAKMHRKLIRAIKRARNIALMPYTNLGDG